MQIYIHHNNQQTGPFTEEEVKAQLAAGTITPQDSVWWQGQAGWVTLAQSSLMTPGAAAIPGVPAPAVPLPGIPAPAVTYAVAKSQQSKLALWALISGCASLVCGLLAALPAIILGHMGLSEIKKNPELSGRGMALTGLILGYVMTVFYSVIIVVSVLIALDAQVKGLSPKLDTVPPMPDTSTNSNQSTTAPDQPAATPTNSDSSTNGPTATPLTPDQSTNSADSSTNSSSTNAAPVSQ